MQAALQQLRISLTLHYRNKMALIYSYLFPLIFLLAFYVLYRYERVVLARHMGELLTVSVLGGACFGLPTTMVSERERGVWRRYRLTPSRARDVRRQTLPPEEPARDDLELEDRLHAFEDRQHLGVDDVAADRILLGITPAAVHELAHLRELDRHVAREQLRLCRERRCSALVAVHRARGGVGDRA